MVHTDFIPYTSWMRDISDSIPLTELSIPGTHNSGSIDGPFGFAQTQDLDLPDQLNAGIRFLDIRLAHYQNNIFVHHDIVHMKKSYADVLDICSDFLRHHPAEVIFMSVKDESRIDSVLGMFAPSEILNTVDEDPAEDPTDVTIESESINPGSFEGIFKAKTWQHVGNASLFYNFTSSRGESGPETADHTPLFETKLGDVRGKIVLLRRFAGGRDIGLDLTYWPENQTFRRTTPLIHSVHDCYLGLGSGQKYELVVAHLEQAKQGDPRDLYITFASAVGLKARGYAEEINSRLNDYLARSLKGRFGIIALDYFDQPRELVSHVIEMNYE